MIIIDIHPLIDENILPIFQEFFKSFDLDDLKDNLIILKKDKTSFNKKED